MCIKCICWPHVHVDTRPVPDRPSSPHIALVYLQVLVACLSLTQRRGEKAGFAENRFAIASLRALCKRSLGIE